MGRAKEIWMETQEKGYSVSQNYTVCSNHFSDSYIIQYINSLSSSGKCHYCGEHSANTIDLEKLIEFLLEGINYFYEDPANEVGWDSGEGGWQIGKDSIFDTSSLLSDEIGLEIDNNDLFNDILVAIFNNEWCLKDPYGLPRDVELKSDWERFCSIVRHKIRFTFFKTKLFDESDYKEFSDILYEIATSVNQLSLFSKISESSIIYRCRQHSGSSVLTKLSDLASPPIEYANFPNRMSPAGISMFYGALNQSTAQLEVEDKSQIKEKPLITMGTFIAKRNLMLLDLTNIPKVPSIFNKEERHYIETIRFLKKFVKNISKSIVQDNKVHTEYVPTQIVTEFFRYVFPEITDVDLDGIAYPSSKDGNVCYVLFFDNVDCNKNFELLKTEIIKLNK